MRLKITCAVTQLIEGTCIRLDLASTFSATASKNRAQSRGQSPLKLQQFVVNSSTDISPRILKPCLTPPCDRDEIRGRRYPMVSTTLAGIELLGGLLLSVRLHVHTKNGMSRFLLFWDNYLVKDFPVYKGFGKLFYNLLRSGIAHTYTAKHGVYVTKGSATPLRFDDTNRRVYIDSNVFAQDFLTAYRNNVTPLVSMVDPTS